MTRNLDEKYDSRETAVHGARLNEHDRRIDECEKQTTAIYRCVEDIRSTLAHIDKTLAMGEQRMNQIDDHIKNTDTLAGKVDGRVVILERESTDFKIKAGRDPITFWTTMGTASTVVLGIITWLAGLFQHSTPPTPPGHP